MWLVCNSGCSSPHGTHACTAASIAALPQIVLQLITQLKLALQPAVHLTYSPRASTLRSSHADCLAARRAVCMQLVLLQLAVLQACRARCSLPGGSFANGAATRRIAHLHPALLPAAPMKDFLHKRQ